MFKKIMASALTLSKHKIYKRVIVNFTSLYKVKLMALSYPNIMQINLIPQYEIRKKKKKGNILANICKICFWDVLPLGVAIHHMIHKFCWCYVPSVRFTFLK